MTYMITDEYSWMETIPVEYESAELLLNDFLNAIKKAHKEKKTYFQFLNAEFVTSDFAPFNRSFSILTVQLPDIQTLDEWFQLNKLCK
jgi:hypothetical protein